MAFETENMRNAGSSGQDVAGENRQNPHEKVRKMKDAALDKVGEARDKARSNIDESKQRVAERIRRVGSALRSSSDSLRQEDEMLATYAERASERIDRAADWVSHANVQDVAHDLEDFARRRPGLFFGAAFAVGLLAGRFLKSTAAPEGLESFESYGEQEPSREMGGGYGYGYGARENLGPSDTQPGIGAPGPQGSRMQTPQSSVGAGTGPGPVQTTGRPGSSPMPGAPGSSEFESRAWSSESKTPGANPPDRSGGTGPGKGTGV